MISAAVIVSPHGPRCLKIGCYIGIRETNAAGLLSLLQPRAAWFHGKTSVHQVSTCIYEIHFPVVLVLLVVYAKKVSDQPGSILKLLHPLSFQFRGEFKLAARTWPHPVSRAVLSITIRATTKVRLN